MVVNWPNTKVVSFSSPNLLVDPCRQKSTNEVALKYNTLVENSITLKKKPNGYKRRPDSSLCQSNSKENSEKTAFQFLM